MAMTNPYDRQARLRGMMSAPSRGVSDFEDDVYEAGGVMPTGGSFSASNNRHLQQRLQTLTRPEDAVAMVGAMGLRDQENRGAQRAGANPMTGGYGWQLFDDYHKTRQNEAALSGNRYNVGGISGGGDVSQRPVSGSGPTRPVGGMQAMNSGQTSEDVTNYQNKRELERLAIAKERLSLKALDNEVFHKNLGRDMTTQDEIYMQGQGALDRPRFNTAVKNEAADTDASRDALRFFMPEVSNKRLIEQANAMDRTTGAARVAGQYAQGREQIIGDWRRDVESTKAGTKAQTQADVASDLLQNVARLSREGAFGMTRGRPNPPPPGLQAAIEQLLTTGISQGGRVGPPPAAGGGAPGPVSAADEAEIAMAMREMNISREEAVAGLRERGLIQ